MTATHTARPAPDAPGAQHRRIGIAMVVLAGVFWSLQGPTVRMIEAASGPQIISGAASASSW